jgi:hypothetical protein
MKDALLPENKEFSFTVLLADKPQTKEFSAKKRPGFEPTFSAYHGRKIFKKGAPGQTEWVHQRFTTHTIKELFALLKALDKQPKRLIVQGLSDKPEKQRVFRRYDSAKGHNDFYKHNQRVVAWDIDEFPGTLSEAWELCAPDWLKGCAHVIQLSASSGLKTITGEDGTVYPLTSAHGFALSDRAFSMDSLKEELRRHNEERIDDFRELAKTRGYKEEDLAKLYGKSGAYNKPIDLALYSPVQPIYTAAPLFLEGLEAPDFERVIFVPGRAFVTLPDCVLTLEEHAARAVKREEEKVVAATAAHTARKKTKERGTPQTYERVRNKEDATLQSIVESAISDMRFASGRHQTMLSVQRLFKSIEQWSTEEGVEFRVPWEELKQAFLTNAGAEREDEWERAYDGAEPYLWAPLRSDAYEEAADTQERVEELKSQLVEVEEGRAEIYAFFDTLEDQALYALLATAGGGKSTISRWFIRRTITRAMGLPDDVSTDELRAMCKELLSDWSLAGAEHRRATNATRKDLKRLRNALEEEDDEETIAALWVELKSAEVAHARALAAKRELAPIKSTEEDAWMMGSYADEQGELIDAGPARELVEALKFLISLPTNGLAKEWVRELRLLGLPAFHVEGRGVANCKSFSTYQRKNRIESGSGTRFCRQECEFRGVCDTPERARVRRGTVNVTTHARLMGLEKFTKDPTWRKLIDERPAHWFQVLNLDSSHVRLARDILETLEDEGGGEGLKKDQTAELGALAKKLERREGAYSQRVWKECAPLIGNDLEEVWKLAKFDVSLPVPETEEHAFFTEALGRAVARDKSEVFGIDMLRALQALGRDLKRGKVTGSGKLDIALPSQVPEWGGQVVFMCATSTPRVAKYILGEDARITKVSMRHHYGTNLVHILGRYAASEGSKFQLSDATLRDLDVTVQNALETNERALIFTSADYASNLRDRYKTIHGERVLVDHYGSATATGSNVYEDVSAAIMLPFHVSVAHFDADGYTHDPTLTTAESIALGAHNAWRSQVIQASARVRPTNSACDIYAYEKSADHRDWWSEEYPLAAEHITYTSAAMLRLKYHAEWDTACGFVNRFFAELVEDWTREGVELEQVEVHKLKRGDYKTRLQESLASMLCDKLSGDGYKIDYIAHLTQLVAPLKRAELLALIFGYLSEFGDAKKDPLPHGFSAETLSTSGNGCRRVVYAGKLTRTRVEAYFSAKGVEVDWFEVEGEPRHHVNVPDTSEIEAAIRAGADTLRAIGRAIGWSDNKVKRTILKHPEIEEVQAWIDTKKQERVTHVPRIAPRPTCDCAACKPFKGYRVVKADAYTVTCDTPKGGTYPLPRAAVASIHVIDAQLPKPEDLDAVCALIDSLPDDAAQVCSGDTLWTRHGTRWSIAPHSTG